MLEAALSRIFDEPVKIAGAGRTDSGVHACGQVVSFETARAFPFDRLRIALNSALPRDLSVREATVVDAGFSARFSALERSYVYAILPQPEPSALLARWSYHVWLPIDLAAMQEASRGLIGTFDFRSFCGVVPEFGGTIRTIRALSIEPRAGLLRMHVVADGFLHRMVRTIAGTLIECGTGRRDPAGLAAIVEGRDRRGAGHTAPAQGLYLAGVRYAGGYDSYAEPPIFGAPR